MNEGIYVPCAPFLYLVGDSVTGSATAGRDGHMEVSRRASPAAPFHYLITEQARSLVALQELQHEVGALLEFRELVMETFPHLRHKLCGGPASSSPGGGGSEGGGVGGEGGGAPSAGQRRDWEPGIRVRRKLSPKAVKGAQPKSGDTLSAGSAVQDSGFSTETSCKEPGKEPPPPLTAPTPPPTSTAPAPASPRATQREEAEDELWNLLDVIQRKGTRLRDEVEVLQEKLQDLKEVEGGGEGPASSDADGLPRAFKPGGSVRGGRSFPAADDDADDDGRFPADQLREVKFERDYLLDKMTEMEAETLSARVRAEELARDVTALAAAKRQLEEQLRTAVSQKGELNSRIHDLHIRFVGSNAAAAVKKPGVGPSAFAPVRPDAASPERSAKQPLTRSATFDAGRAAKPSPVRPVPNGPPAKQPPARSDTFKLAAGRLQRRSPSAFRSPERSLSRTLSADERTGGSVRSIDSISEYPTRPVTLTLSATHPKSLTETIRKRSVENSITKSPSRLTARDASLTKSPTRSAADDGSITMLPTRATARSITMLPIRSTAKDESIKTYRPTARSITMSPTRSTAREASITKSPTPPAARAASITRQPSRPPAGDVFAVESHTQVKVRLGQLDGVVSNPSKAPRGLKPDMDKMAAILLETNVVELQRHLLVTCVENQHLSAHDVQLRKQIVQLADDNDELSFRLAEREIELESARAQLRLLDRPPTTASSPPPPPRPRPRPSKIPKSFSAPRPPAPAAPAVQSNGRPSLGERTNASLRAVAPSIARTAPLVARTASVPSLNNGRSIQPPTNRPSIGQSNRSLSSNSLNKKRGGGGGGGKRDVSIGYRKEGRRESLRKAGTKEEGKEEGKRVDDSMTPWANDSSSEYFDSINESGSLLLDSEPSHWLTEQREAMADCDSLELAESNQWGQSH